MSYPCDTSPVPYFIRGGAVGNGLLVNKRVTFLVYHRTALAAYSTGSVKRGNVVVPASPVPMDKLEAQSVTRRKPRLRPT